MASLCLPRAKLLVGMRWDDDAELAALLGDPGHPPILLYPGPGARDVLRDPPAGPVTLVVVDGTWPQSRSVVRRNPRLAALPRYAFAAPAPSEYRVRREPRSDYVSTIEALMHVLGALEGDAARFRTLLDPFRAMVDAHLACQARCPRARKRRPRHPSGRPGPGVPPVIAARFADLVCVVAESDARHDPSAERGIRHQLVHWVARRIAGGETFSALVAPEEPLASVTPERVGLSEDRIREGAPRAEVVADFARFLRPADVVCSWGPFAPRLFRESGGTLPEAALDIRGVARRLSGRKIGSLEQVGATFERAADPAPPATPARADIEGRAGRRLRHLEAIVAAYRSR